MKQIEQETFKMTYSAQEQDEIHKIRQKYVPQEPDKMSQLRALDTSATKKATTLSLVFGVVGSLILGIGMSLIMSDFGAILGSAAFPIGIVIGLIGLILIGLAYPLYHHNLKKEREKIAPDILRLSEELLK